MFLAVSFATCAGVMLLTPLGVVGVTNKGPEAVFSDFEVTVVSMLLRR